MNLVDDIAIKVNSLCSRFEEGEKYFICEPEGSRAAVRDLFWALDLDKTGPVVDMH